MLAERVLNVELFEQHLDHREQRQGERDAPEAEDHAEHELPGEDRGRGMSSARFWMKGVSP